MTTSTDYPWLIVPPYLDGAEHVYCIGDGQGHVKIGRTNNLHKRLQQLQHANPNQLAVYHSFAFLYPREVAKAERAAHEAAKAFRIRGEWFYEDDALEIFVRTFAKSAAFYTDAPHMLPPSYQFDMSLDINRRPK